MQDVLRSHSLSQALSIKAALELEGIRAELFNENALGYMNLAGEIRVMVHDADEDRTRALIHALERLMGLAGGLFILGFMLEGYILRLHSAAVLIAVIAVGGLGALLLLIGLLFLEEKPPSPWADQSAEGATGRHFRRNGNRQAALTKEDAPSVGVAPTRPGDYAVLPAPTRLSLTTSLGVCVVVVR
jgi:putative signal transducing protein